MLLLLLLQWLLLLPLELMWYHCWCNVASVALLRVAPTDATAVGALLVFLFAVVY